MENEADKYEELTDMEFTRHIANISRLKDLPPDNPLSELARMVSLRIEIVSLAIPSPIFFKVNYTTIFCGSYFKQIQYVDTIPPSLS